jgi:hypothetical protein
MANQRMLHHMFSTLEIQRNQHSNDMRYANQKSQIEYAGLTAKLRLKSLYPHKA